MASISPKGNRSAIWLSPFAGASLAAFYLTMRGLAMSGGAFFDGLAFFVWFIQRAILGYLIAIPVMGVAYKLGLRYAAGFMVLASLAALPLEFRVSNPLNAWHPSVEELDHGFYWVAFWPCVLFASATGLAFSCGLPRCQKANQSTDPTLSSGTPAAEQPARHP